MNPRWSPPAHWPVVDTGLLMAGIGNVMVVCLTDAITSAASERHLRELALAIDSRRSGPPIGVLYDQGAPLIGDARQRARVATLLKERRAVLERTTAAFALCTSSPVMRGILRAVFWLEPPPYPWSVVADVGAGLHYLREHMPELDVGATHAEYRRLRGSRGSTPPRAPQAR